MTNPSDDRRDDLPEDAGASEDFLDFLEDAGDEPKLDRDAGADAAPQGDAGDAIELDDDFELNLFDDESDDTSPTVEPPLSGNEPVVPDDLTFDLEETTDEGLPDLAAGAGPHDAGFVTGEAVPPGDNAHAGEDTERFPESPAEEDDAFEFQFEEAATTEEASGDDEFEFELELGDDAVHGDESAIGIEQANDEPASIDAVEFNITADDKDSGEERAVEAGASGEVPDLKLAPAEETVKAADMALDDLPSAGETMQVAPVVKVKRSPMITLVKIGIGALLGIVIFQVGAWWAGFDFLGLAPKLPAAVAWLAPAHLRQDLSQPIRRSTPPRAEPAATDAGGDETPQDPADPTPSEQAFGDTARDDLRAADSTQPDAAAVPEEDLMVESTTEAAELSTDAATPPDDAPFETRVDDLETGVAGDDKMAQPPLDEPAMDNVTAEAGDALPPALDLSEPEGRTTGDRLPAEDPLDDGLAAEPIAATDERRETAPPMRDEDDGAFDLDTDEGTLDLNMAEQAPPAAPRGIPVGPLPAKWFTADEVTDALAAAQTADERLDEAQLSKQGLREAARDFYVALANLAERFTYAEPQVKHAMTQPTRALAARFEFDDKKQKLIGNAARQWYERRLGQGMVLAGTASNVQSDGSITTLSLTLLGKSSPSMVVVARQTDAIRDGQRLLVFGTLIEDAAQNLPGYTGSEPRVVWEGMFYPLP